MKLRTGKAGENVLDRSVRKRLNTVCKPDERKMVVETVSNGSYDAGYLSVMAAANGIYAEGMIPSEMQTSVILPVESQEEELRSIEDQIAEAAKELRVCVTGGHTAVSSAVNRIVVTTAAAGIEPAAFKGAKAGQEIIMTKWTALQGTYLLASMKEKELLKRFPVSILETCREMRTLINCSAEGNVFRENRGGLNISYVTDLSEGGVYAALWKTAVDTGCGLEVSLPDIPIRQETIEICNFYDINPYETDSAGSMLAVCDDGQALVTELAEAGIHAAVIGRLTGGNDKHIINLDECGNLNLPQPDALLAVLR